MGPGTRTYQETTVPPRSNIMYKVTISQKVMDTSRLNPYFTLQKALTKKKIANDLYQYEWCPAPQSKDDPMCEQAMNRAIQLYSKAAKEMETLLQGNYFQNVEQNHPQRLESQRLLLDALNNIVAVHLKQKEYHKAKLASVDVLQVDAHNLKALLRAAKAAMLDPASTLEEAKAAIVAAEADITYKNPDEEKQLQRLKVLFKKKQQEYRDASKSMFGNKLKSADAKKDKDRKMPTSTSGQEDESAVKEKSSTGIDSTEDESAKGEEEQAVIEQEEPSKKGSLWKQQAISAFGQVVIPLLMFVLYRHFNPEKFELKASATSTTE
ncbi:MAG: hypothetical protein SGILL_009074 [Bacillariaceae sp.]